MLADAQALIVLLSALASFGLAAAGLLRRRQTWLHRSFGVGMVGFGVESLAALMLVAHARSPDEYRGWLKVLELLGIIVPLPWAVFVAALVSGGNSWWRAARRPAVIVVGLISVAVLALAAVTPTGELAHTAGGWTAVRITPVSWVGIALQLLATVGILAGLEAAFRTSKGGTRWRIKYLVVGLVGIFLARFYLLSQTLMFQVWTPSALTTRSGIVLVGDLVIAASLVRDRLLSTELVVSRQLLYRSAVVGVLGLYLLVAGLMGWLVNWLEIPETLFWGSLLVFVSAIVLTIVLLSEDVRWRLQRAISRQFYTTKYDYREQWRRFTRRLGSLLTTDDLSPELLGAVMDTVGAVRGVLYLAGEPRGRLRLAAGSGVVPPVAPLELPAAIVDRLVSRRSAILVEGNGTPSSVVGVPALAAGLTAVEPAILLPLVWRDELVGLIALGPERTGARYSFEDLELLTTLGEQAAGAVVTVQLSEKMALAREFEAFHRLTSFVIHDLKNSIAALSLLTQNLATNFADPEFQRDAARTLTKTVGRMEALLAKLTAGPADHALRFEPIDLSAIVDETLEPLTAGTRVRLVKEIQPLPAVMADAEALRRVFQNLLTNAVEATDGNGQVTVTAYAEGDQAVVRVTDNGHGIPPEFLNRFLFTPFRSTKKGGWGIGLYQARNLVEAHGGTIEVASREGEGTSFWVKLPLAGRVGRPS